jgi:hypothetical protein
MNSQAMKSAVLAGGGSRPFALPGERTSPGRADANRAGDHGGPQRGRPIRHR